MPTQEILSEELEHAEQDTNSIANSKERLKRYEETFRDYFMIQGTAGVQKNLLELYNFYVEHADTTPLRLADHMDTIGTLMRMHMVVEMTYRLKRARHAGKVSKR